MLLWMLCGIVAGWFLATRLQVGSLAAFLLSSVALPLVIFVVLRRFDYETIIGFAAFWATVQAGYLAFNLGRAAREPAPAPVPESLTSA